MWNLYWLPWTHTWENQESSFADFLLYTLVPSFCSFPSILTNNTADAKSENNMFTTGKNFFAWNLERWEKPLCYIFQQSDRG